MDNVKETRELAMYGCLIADFKESIEDSLTFVCSGPVMCAMSLMSDAQHEVANGDVETARKTINRAKWILSEYSMNTLKL